MILYRERIVDKILEEKLTSKGAVVIEGPKWCGKTTTAKQFAKSTVFMDDPAKEQQYRELLSISPGRLLEQKILRGFRDCCSPMHVTRVQVPIMK